MPVYAVIVLYNPDISLLERNLAAVSPQVDKIILVDNGSKAREELRSYLEQCRYPVEILWNEENLGIATALNQAVRLCSERQVDWLLTLDQDSVIPRGMIETYRQYVDLPQVGQLSCGFYNPDAAAYPSRKTDRFADAESEGSFSEVSACITSGCLMSVPVCVSVGLFYEPLFIDDVDYEYSFHIRRQGYKVYKIRDIQMEHRLGNGVLRRFLWLSYMDYHYPPTRVYYQARNGFYMLRAFSEQRRVFALTLLHALGTSLMAGRFASVRAFFRGMRDGFRMELRCHDQ